MRIEGARNSGESHYRMKQILFCWLEPFKATFPVRVYSCPFVVQKCSKPRLSEQTWIKRLGILANPLGCASCGRSRNATHQRLSTFHHWWTSRLSISSIWQRWQRSSASVVNRDHFPRPAENFSTFHDWQRPSRTMPIGCGSTWRSSGSVGKELPGWIRTVGDKETQRHREHGDGLTQSRSVFSAPLCFYPCIDANLALSSQ